MGQTNIQNMADTNRSLACSIFYMSRQWGHGLPGPFVVVVVLIGARPRLWRHPSAASMILAESGTQTRAPNLSLLIHPSIMCTLWNVQYAKKIGQLMSKRESELFQSLTNVNISSQNVVHNAIWLLGSALKPARNVHFLHAIFKKTAIFHPITSIFHIKCRQSQMVWNLTKHAQPCTAHTFEGYKRKTAHIGNLKLAIKTSSFSRVERHQGKKWGILEK